MAITIKILDSLYLAFAIIFTCTVIGLVMLKTKNKPIISDIGWGIFYGSLTIIILSCAFLVWLTYNFPK